VTCKACVRYWKRACTVGLGCRASLERAATDGAWKTKERESISERRGCWWEALCLWTAGLVIGAGRGCAILGLDSS
jgi:hypothetical protein